MRGGEAVAVVDADIRIEILRSADALNLDRDSEFVKRALETGRIAQEEGIDFDAAFDMARSELVRGTLSAV